MCPRAVRLSWSSGCWGGGHPGTAIVSCPSDGAGAAAAAMARRKGGGPGQRKSGLPQQRTPPSPDPPPSPEASGLVQQQQQPPPFPTCPPWASASPAQEPHALWPAGRPSKRQLPSQDLCLGGEWRKPPPQEGTRAPCLPAHGREGGGSGAERLGAGQAFGAKRPSPLPQQEGGSSATCLCSAPQPQGLPLPGAPSSFSKAPGLQGGGREEEGSGRAEGHVGGVAWPCPKKPSRCLPPSQAMRAGQREAAKDPTLEGCPCRAHASPLSALSAPLISCPPPQQPH